MPARRAFTLIELLVVVAIIALLIALLLPSLGRAREQAKLVKCGTNMKSMFNAIASYAAQNQDIIVQSGAFYRDDVATIPPAGPTKDCAILSFPEQLWLDGDLTNYQNPYTTGSGHFPITQQKRSIFYCPSADKSVQYGMSGSGYDGYGLSWFQRSHMMNGYNTASGKCGGCDGNLPNPQQNVQPVIKKLARAVPSKILAFEGYYTPGDGGTVSYFVYNRHFGRSTTTTNTIDKYRGVSNYLFLDGHVEPNGDYLKQTPPRVRTTGMSYDTACSISPWGGEQPFPP
jgi:prepilin-type N-terminal cleavage/methylation domain-containing protein/prepilin-type processing-associated H-X9-DG protein